MASDSDPASIKSLGHETEDLSQRIEGLRVRRDKLNAETKRWMLQRDELNARVRQSMATIEDHKHRRDELNRKVAEAKRVRDECNRRASELGDKVSALKRERLPKEGSPLGVLKRDIKRMEFEQMTKVLTPQQEREVVEGISAIRAQIKEKEGLIEQDQELKEAIEQHKKAWEEAEKQHHHVMEIADEAQAEHDDMVRLFEEVIQIKEEADKAHERFIKTRRKADECHADYIEMIKRVRAIERQIADIQQKEKKEARAAMKSEVEQQAAEIFERLKAGKKLSTEDILMLQKAGLL